LRLAPGAKKMPPPTEPNDVPRHHSATDTANAYQAPRLGQQSASYRMTRLAKKALYNFALMCWLVVIASGFYLVWT
jgi:hypothetical protein